VRTALLHDGNFFSNQRLMWMGAETRGTYEGKAKRVCFLLLIALICPASDSARGQSAPVNVSGDGPSGSGGPWYNVRAFGAQGNGAIDDIAAIQLAVAAACASGGGNVYFPNGIYKHSKTVQVSRNGCSNVWLVAEPGAVLDFQPKAPFSPCGNDRQVCLGNGPATADTQIAISGPIAVGATSFTTVATPTARIVPGTWLNIALRDSGLGDVAAFDWAQVASVSGNKISVTEPFQTRFTPGEGQTLTFDAFTDVGTGDPQPLHNVGIVGFILRNRANIGVKESSPTIATMWPRGAWVLNNTINLLGASSTGLYSYRSAGAHFQNNRVLSMSSNAASANEFGESTDIVIDGNTFEVENATGSDANATVLLDFALNRFHFTNNRINFGANIAVLLQGAPANGVVAGNTIGWVNGSAPPHQGILGLGVTNTLIAHNRLIGTSGGGQAGIALVDCVPPMSSAKIVSAGNIVAFNRITNFSPAYAVLNSGDLVIGDDGAGNLELNHILGSYNSLTTTGTGVAPILGAFTQAGLTTNLASVALYTTRASGAGSAGTYRVCVNAWTTTSGTGETTTVNVIYNNGSATIIKAIAPTLALNSLSSPVDSCTTLHSAAGQAIQVSTTAGKYGTSVYALDATVEQVR
jgi:hypothetical protein